jgi:hypothetical protein
MSARDSSHVPKAKEKPDREAPVDEPVVNDQVSEPEEAHPDAHAERDLAHRAGGRLAAHQDERDRERRVQHGERVVRLEARPMRSRDMVRSVDRPEPGVPHPAVEERGPEVHRHGHSDGDRYPHERSEQDAAHDATLGRTA